MICLTIDYTLSNLRKEQEGFGTSNEAKVLLRFLDILEAANVDTTLFLSSHSFENDCETFQEICDNPIVEIGGHNLCEHTPLNWSRYWLNSIGQTMGPNDFQRWQIKRTVDTIYNKTGRKIRAWRNSTLSGQAYDMEFLAENGILVCSGQIDPCSAGPVWNAEGIINFPINVQAHEMQPYHSMALNANTNQPHRDRLQCEEHSQFNMEVWALDLLENLTQNEMHGVISQVTLDPMAMYLSDNFKTFEDYVLEYLELRDTVQISRIYDWEVERFHYANRQN